MEKFPQRGFQQDPSRSEEDKKLELLRALSPSTARIFKELQNPALSKEEFMNTIEEYNDNLRGKQPAQKGRYQTVTAEVSSTRSVSVDFNREGLIDLKGRDFSKE